MERVSRLWVLYAILLIFPRPHNYYLALVIFFVKIVKLRRFAVYDSNRAISSATCTAIFLFYKVRVSSGTRGIFAAHIIRLFFPPSVSHLIAIFARFVIYAPMSYFQEGLDSPSAWEVSSPPLYPKVAVCHE